MENYLSEYLPILIFIIIGFAIAIGMTTLSFVVGARKPDNEKLSAYECGFEAFDDARGRFDVRFYLVAILFIIFDLEVAFLFPWAISLGSIGIFGFWSIIHIYFLIGYRNRLIVFTNWVWSYLSYSKGARLITNNKIEKNSS